MRRFALAGLTRRWRQEDFGIHTERSSERYEVVDVDRAPELLDLRDSCRWDRPSLLCKQIGQRSSGYPAHCPKASDVVRDGLTGPADVVPVPLAFHDSPQVGREPRHLRRSGLPDLR